MTAFGAGSFATLMYVKSKLHVFSIYLCFHSETQMFYIVDHIAHGSLDIYQILVSVAI